MSEYNLKIQKMLERNNIAELVDVRSYDEESRLFYIKNNDKKSYLGGMWLCNPLAGASEATIRILESVLSTDFPGGSFMTSHLISTPMIAPLLRHYKQARHDTINDTDEPDKAKLVRMFIDNRIQFINKYTKEKTNDESRLRLKDNYIILSIKFPCHYLPTEDDISKAETQCYSIEQTLDSLNLLPQRLNQRDYLSVMRSIIHMGEVPDLQYDPNRTLNYQVFDYEDEFVIKKDSVELNDKHIKSLSVHFYPEETLLPVMGNLLGDKAGSQNQITCPFILSTTIYFPEQHSTISSINKNASALSYQISAPYARFAPKLALKHDGFKNLQTEIQKGGRVVQCWTNILIIGESAKEMTEQSRQAKNWFKVCDYELKEDIMFSGPAFQQQLPFNASPEMVTYSERYHKMTSKMAAHILPIIGDWKGNGVGANDIFFSRRGQVQLWCPFDSETNMNGFISGDSGAGKSVFSQGVIFNLWSRGTIIRIIDSGRSYIKLTKLVGGEFIEFSGETNLKINPFSDIKDIIKELPPLIGVLEQMCAPKDGLSDFQARMLEKFTLQVFNQLGNDMTITDLSEALLHAGSSFSEDSEGAIPGVNMDLDQYQISDIQKIGHQLFPFTRHGPYGDYFDGKANLTMSGDWSVLELDDLREMPELQNIVLMMLIIKMNRDYYLAPRNYKKLLVIDEAWRFLKAEGSDAEGVDRIQQYIIGSFRLFRKLNASIIVITQSPLDLSPDGNSPIIQNSANILLLNQKESTINTLEKNKVLSISYNDYQQLKTVKTVKGKFSEVFIYTSGRGFGIARYMLDPFWSLLVSTDPSETSGINRYIDLGYGVADAIFRYMDEADLQKVS